MKEHHLICRTTFSEILPYENSYVRVKCECGYRVEFKRTNTIIKIPRYPFWKAFEDYFDWKWKDEAQQSDSDVEESEAAAEDKEPIEPISEAHNYSSFVIKTYKYSGSMWHEEEGIEKAFDKIRELIQKYDDIQQIHIVPKKVD